MKKTYLFTFSMLVSVKLFCQVLSPVKWSYGKKILNNKEAIVYLKASIENGWHIYSVYQKEGGPVKTSFVFSKSNKYFLSGKFLEPKPITKFEKNFGINVSYFENSVIFKQKIKLMNRKSIVIGSVTFMVCNDLKCLPPDEVEFRIPIN